MLAVVAEKTARELVLMFAAWSVMDTGSALIVSGSRAACSLCRLAAASHASTSGETSSMTSSFAHGCIALDTLGCCSSLKDCAARNDEKERHRAAAHKERWLFFIFSCRSCACWETKYYSEIPLVPSGINSAAGRKSAPDY